MKDGLYNRGVYGLPAGVAEKFVAPVIDLHYARHAYEESKADRYGVPELPSQIELVAQDVVEVLVQLGNVAKLIVRYPYDDKLDLVLVLVPLANAPRNFFVKTLWFRTSIARSRLAPYSRP